MTLFSAPNYCGEFDNAGAMMSVDETLLCSFQVRLAVVFFLILTNRVTDVFGSLRLLSTLGLVLRGDLFFCDCNHSHRSTHHPITTSRHFPPRLGLGFGHRLPDPTTPRIATVLRARVCVYDRFSSRLRKRPNIRTGQEEWVVDR